MHEGHLISIALLMGGINPSGDIPTNFKSSCCAHPICSTLTPFIRSYSSRANELYCDRENKPIDFVAKTKAETRLEFAIGLLQKELNKIR